MCENENVEFYEKCGFSLNNIGVKIQMTKD